MSAVEYPDLHEIPPPRRAPLVPMPSIITKLFSQFPLQMWPAARVASTDVHAAPTKPVLYIIPPRTAGAWASVDPVCLRWQLEFHLRGACVDYRPLEDAYWAPDGMSTSEANSGHMPFVEAPGRREPLVGLPQLPRYVDHFYPLQRKEHEDATLWSEAAEAESTAWANLLEGRIMAGVLLLALRTGICTPPSTPQSPALRRWFASLLPSETTSEQRAIATLARLSTAGASPEGLYAVFGSDYLADMRNPLSLVPGYAVDISGVLSGGLPHNQQDDEPSARIPAGLRLDQEAIIRNAADALEAVSVRLAQDDESGASWMLGARHV